MRSGLPAGESAADRGGLPYRALQLFLPQYRGGRGVAPAFRVEDWYQAGLKGRGAFELIDVIRERQRTMPENSYTSYLFSKGLDKILKKIGEESAELLSPPKP